MTVSNCVSGASFDTVSAEDAAVVIDVIDGRVAFGAADTVLGRILSCLDVDAIGWTGSCAKKAGNTLFQAVLVALQHVETTKALLELGAAKGPRPVRIVLPHRRLEHLLESNRHTFGDGADALHDRHISIIPALFWTLG